ncbi:hypothetical protein [Riemerella anatipestifer]|uniref:hypothetical protein n=1 Tax=Riemerella anatipestifer TaxID=34085 RepID=UPI00129E99B6|nr:hypothetical protein [Riemerella anatipestifer]MRM83402.1 hypothetical protein [Riemerella anatipestifer]
MKLKREIKEMLLRQPKYLGNLIAGLNKPDTTVKRWLREDYKDLRLPENVKILEEVTGLSREEIFEEDKQSITL